MTRMTGPDCVVIGNLINTYIHTHIHTYIRTYIHTYWYIHTYMHTYIHTYITSIIDPPLGGSLRVALTDSDDRAGLRGYVKFNKYTYIHTHIHTSRLIRGFRNKYH